MTAAQSVVRLKAVNLENYILYMEQFKAESRFTTAMFEQWNQNYRTPEHPRYIHTSVVKLPWYGITAT